MSAEKQPKSKPEGVIPDLDIINLPPERPRSAHPETFNLDVVSFLVGPFAGLVALTLSWLGFPMLFILAMCCVIAWLFVFRADLSAEFFVRILFSFTTNTFFRELKCSNEHRIPETGPVVFVCAPHANQFLDPAVIVEFIKRPVSFLIAAKSYRSGLVGLLARAQRSIPVERPQDLATPCQGTIMVDGLNVTGTGTTFLADFSSSDSLLVSNSIVHIASINSDTSMTLKEVPDPIPATDVAHKYKRVPKVNQNMVYKSVWKALADGHCVGIFPEGGSHDRTELLPLKAGVALMALGAAANYPGLDVKIITVGLNYFHGHRFRGRVFVEFGDPFSLPMDLVEKFREGGQQKVSACNSLLETIRDQLRAVTVSSPSWDQLQLLWAVRRLYQPSGVRLPPKLNMILIRRFAEGYELLKDRKEVIDLVHDVHEYNTHLRDYGLRDHQVDITNYSRLSALWRLISRTTRLVMIAVFAIPGTILNAPIAITTRIISRKKASEALKASNVKVAGRDVLASWKVITSMMILPLVFIVYPTIAAIIGYLANGKPLATWGNFAVLQPLMMWASVRATETWFGIYRSLRPLVLAVFDKTGGGVRELRKERQQLKTRLRSLVDTLGPEIYGPEFHALRLFNPELFKKQASKKKTSRLERLGLGTSSLQESLANSFEKSFSEMDDDNDLVQSLSYVDSSPAPVASQNTVLKTLDEVENNHNHNDIDNENDGLDPKKDSTSNISTPDAPENDKNLDTDPDYNQRESLSSPLSLSTDSQDYSDMSELDSPDSHTMSEFQLKLAKQFDQLTKKFESDYTIPESYKSALSGLSPISLSDIGGITSDFSRSGLEDLSDHESSIHNENKVSQVHENPEESDKI